MAFSFQLQPMPDLVGGRSQVVADDVEHPGFRFVGREELLVKLAELVVFPMEQFGSFYFIPTDDIAKQGDQTEGCQACEQRKPEGATVGLQRDPGVGLRWDAGVGLQRSPGVGLTRLRAVGV